MTQIFIGNNCLTSYYYKINNEQFNMPFVYSVISDENYFCLCDNFLKLNFKNVVFGIEEKHKVFKRPYVYAVIDQMVRVDYIHYVYDKDQLDPTKKNGNIYYKDIIEYCNEKYNKRLDRMLSRFGSPHVYFIYTQYNYDKSKPSPCIKFDELKLAFRKMYLTNNKMEYNLCKKLKTPCYLINGDSSSIPSFARQLNDGLKTGKMKF